MSSKTETPLLRAATRTLTGHQTKQLRRTGQLPAVMYGNVSKNQNLELNAHDFSKLYNQVGTSTLIDLAIDEAKPVKVLVHDVQINPVRNELIHVDFYAVNLKEKLTTEIPIEFVGVADAVDILGGIFVTVMDSVEIECLPEDLPQHLEVDITSLKTFEDSIRIKDLPALKGVTILGDAEEVVASITEPISEEELAALDEAPATEPTTEFETTSGTDKVEETPEAK